MFLSGGLLFFCAEVAAIPMIYTYHHRLFRAVPQGTRSAVSFPVPFSAWRALLRDQGEAQKKNLRREVGFVGSIGSKEGERRLSATLPTVDKVTSNEGVAAIRKVVIA